MEIPSVPAPFAFLSVMKIAEKPTDTVAVPRELWDIMKTWPDAMNRCKVSSSGLLFTLKEMEDLLKAEELMRALR